MPNLTHVPPPPTVVCPICTLPSQSAVTHTDPNQVVTASHICAVGHIWQVRWVAQQVAA